MKKNTIETGFGLGRYPLTRNRAHHPHIFPTQRTSKGRVPFPLSFLKQTIHPIHCEVTAFRILAMRSASAGLPARTSTDCTSTFPGFPPVAAPHSRRTEASSFHTAAGLLGICTRFPFDARLPAQPMPTIKAISFYHIAAINATKNSPFPYLLTLISRRAIINAN